MANLERMVRRELIEERAEENYKVMISPEYRETIRKMMDEIAGTDFALDEEINSKFFSLPALKKNALESAEGACYSRAETAYTMDSARESLKEIIDAEKLGQLKAAEAPYLSSLELMDKYIAGIVDVANANGIEAALSQESRDEVYRQLFPAAEEYIAFHKGLNENIYQYADCLLNLLQGADGADEMSLIREVILKCAEVTKNALTAKAEQDAERIYRGN